MRHVKDDSHLWFAPAIEDLHLEFAASHEKIYIFDFTTPREQMHLDLQQRIKI